MEQQRQWASFFLTLSHELRWIIQDELNTNNRLTNFFTSNLHNHRFFKILSNLLVTTSAIKL